MSRLIGTPWLWGVVATLAWGVAAFGSPYPWAYTPLLIASGCLGLLGLWLGRRRAGPTVLLTLCLASIALAIIIQLVPIPVSRLGALSPHATSLLTKQSLLFSLGGLLWHPLSIDPARTQLGLAFFAALCLLMLGTARALTHDTANRLAGALVILGVAVAMAGIVQRAVFNGKIYGFWELVQGGIPFGPFVNRNHFAGWMLMALPVALGLFLALVSRGMGGRQGFRNLVLWFSTEQASRAVLTGFAILVMALSLVLTLSRSGMAALAATLVLMGAVLARRQTGASRRIAVSYLAFLVMAVVLWVGLDRIAARFAESNAATAGGRLGIWADTVTIANDFWLTGTGFNTFGVSTLYYQTVAQGQHLREAHNDYLQLAAEGGLLLGIPVVLTILAFSWEVRRRLRQDIGSIWWIRMGAVAGLLAVALQSTAEFSLQMPGNGALFAVLAGMAIHDGRRLSDLTSGSAQPNSGSPIERNV